MIKQLTHSKQTRSNEEGFTLIELMIVVVIIGILAAIAIPIFLNQQKEAMLATAKVDIKNTATAVTTFTAKNNGKLPTSCTDMTTLINSVPASPGNEIRYFYSRTAPYVYYIRVAPTDDYFLNAGGVEAEDQYRFFYLSDQGKVYNSKQELARALTGQGTSITAWLADNSFIGVMKSGTGTVTCNGGGASE